MIFTTVTKWGADFTATPTRVGSEKVKEAGECCIFYNETHNTLDFTVKMI